MNNGALADSIGTGGAGFRAAIKIGIADLAQSMADKRAIPGANSILAGISRTADLVGITDGIPGKAGLIDDQTGAGLIDCPARTIADAFEA